MAKILVVTSGKGGVGKPPPAQLSAPAWPCAVSRPSSSTSTSACVTSTLSWLRTPRGVRLRQRRQRRGHLTQALIRTSASKTPYVLAASQTRDKDALTKEGVESHAELRKDFEYIICDSAGIEKGAHLAMYFADEAIVVTNPEVSSVRDSDRMLGLLASKSQRAEKGEEPIKEHLLLTRYNPERVTKGEMLGVDDVEEILAIRPLG